MSIESVAKALVIKGLAPSQKLVLIGLANHDGDGGCWPGVVTLCDYTDLKERQVQYILGQLADLGLIEIVHNAGGHPGMRLDKRPNLYVLHLDRTAVELSTDSERGAVECTPRNDSRGAVEAPRGAVANRENAARGAVATAPEPSFNHPSETRARDDAVDNSTAAAAPRDTADTLDRLDAQRAGYAEAVEAPWIAAGLTREAWLAQLNHPAVTHDA